MKKSTKSVKYDDIQWHLNEDFPSDLSPKNALTHLKDSVLPFFGQINSKEKIENFWSDFF